jgi:hypothetical protein
MVRSVDTPCHTSGGRQARTLDRRFDYFRVHFYNPPGRLVLWYHLVALIELHSFTGGRREVDPGFIFIGSQFDPFAQYVRRDLQ